MSRYGSWEDRPREGREQGRGRWRGEGEDWREEDRWRGAERPEDRRRAAERDDLERDWQRDWERERERSRGASMGEYGAGRWSEDRGMAGDRPMYGVGGRGTYRTTGPQEGWRGYEPDDDWRARAWREEHRREIDPPWVERGPAARGRDSRGLVEWEDRGPLAWLGDKARRATGRGPKGYTRSDDRIHDEVCERIARSGVDADEVEVKVEAREVTLTGTVRSRDEKWRLEDVAEDVFGVEEVHNHLRVSRAERDAGTAGRTDTDAIEGRLRH